MSENLGNEENAAEFDREQALDGVIQEYFPEDAEFLGEHELEDRIGAVYGQLQEIGEDPDVVLKEAGVFEDEEEDEV